MKKKTLAALAASVGLAATLAVAAPAHATPTAPHNLVIDQITQSTVRAQWQSVTGAELYQLTANGAYAASSSDTVEILDGLTCGTQYLIQTKVKVGGEWSPLSGPTSSGSKTITTASCTTPPPSGSGSAATDLGWGTPIAAGSDEFNYTGAPDSNKWNNYNTAGHHGNGQRLQAQSTVDGNKLRQTGLSNGDTGYISSTYRPGTLYGKWEARMRTNVRDAEYHPVILLWPDSGGNVTTEDEVDFAEGTNDTSKIKFFLHYGAAGSSTQTSAEQTIDTTQWHNYAVSWTSTGVRGYIDGALWFEDTSSTHNPDQAMHSSIQLDWFPDGSSTTQSWMEVDWIRAYEASSGTPLAPMAAPKPAPPATVNVLLSPFGDGQYQCSVDYPAPNTNCELDIDSGFGNVHLKVGTDGKYTCKISFTGYADRPCRLTTAG